MIGNYIERVGLYILNIIESSGEILVFLYKAIIASFSRPFNFRLVLEQIDEIGFKSIPIVIASAMAIGMVMVVQLAWGFVNFGAKGLVGPLVSLSFVRELGGITAEIGSMKVTEQIDAMRTMGADPMKKLVAPRLLAAILSFPILAMIADFSGILGASHSYFYLACWSG